MTDPLAPDELQIAFHDVECATYDERFGIAFDGDAAANAVREVSRLVGPGRLGRVLDVGCGTGFVGLGLAVHDRVDELHAVDISPGMLERASENAASLGVSTHIVRGSAMQLPYADGAFDAVVSRGVLHHLHDPGEALREWRRVVRPGGPVVVLSEPTPMADQVGGWAARIALTGLAVARKAATALGRPLSSHTKDDAESHRFWDLVAMAANLHTFTPDELESLACRSGFRDVRVTGSGLVSIVWASTYYLLVGELPGLAVSERAKRRAGRVWSLTRALDATLVDRLVPDRLLLTTTGVFSATNDEE